MTYAIDAHSRQVRVYDSDRFVGALGWADLIPMRGPEDLADLCGDADRRQVYMVARDWLIDCELIRA